MNELAKNFLVSFSEISSTTTILATAQLLVLIASGWLVVLQLKKSTQEVSKTHEWNRRKASQEACYEFLRSPIQEEWSAIYSPLLIEQKKYSDLTVEQQESVRRVLYFLENLGILMKHNIVDEDIIYDFFGSIWTRLYTQVEEYVRQSQISRNDTAVYENFANFAKSFHDNFLKELKQKPCAVPAKPLITG